MVPQKVLDNATYARLRTFDLERPFYKSYNNTNIHEIVEENEMRMIFYKFYMDNYIYYEQDGGDDLGLIFCSMISHSADI